MLSEANSGGPCSLVDVAEREKKPTRGATRMPPLGAGESQVRSGPLKAGRRMRGQCSTSVNLARDSMEGRGAGDIKNLRR